MCIMQYYSVCYTMNTMVDFNTMDVIPLASSVNPLYERLKPFSAKASKELSLISSRSAANQHQCFLESHQIGGNRKRS